MKLITKANEDKFKNAVLRIFNSLFQIAMLSSLINLNSKIKLRNNLFLQILQ